MRTPGLPWIALPADSQSYPLSRRPRSSASTRSNNSGSPEPPFFHSASARSRFSSLTLNELVLTGFQSA